MEKQVIYSAIRTPDGTLLESLHRHDYKSHKDTLTGNTYGIDGGNDYFRFIGDVYDCEVITHYSDEPQEVVRQYVRWGTYGKNGDQPLYWIKMCDMTNDHIEAIIDDGIGGKTIRELFNNELIYREVNNIIIEN